MVRTRPVFAKTVTYVAVYTVHVISQIIDGGAIEADGGASAPVGPTVATPLLVAVSSSPVDCISLCQILKAKHCSLSPNICFAPPTAPHPMPFPPTHPL